MKKMNQIIGLLFVVLLVSQTGWAQNKGFKLDNALIIVQQDDYSDRFSLEVALLQLFSQYKVKAEASLNILKQGEPAQNLMDESVVNDLKEKGIDTYLLVAIRGYDSRFKASKNILPLEEELTMGHLFPLYRDGITRVTFSFTFYRNLEPIHQEMIKTGSVGSREAVIRKLLKGVEDKILKDWK